MSKVVEKFRQDVVELIAESGTQVEEVGSGSYVRAIVPTVLRMGMEDRGWVNLPYQSQLLEELEEVGFSVIAAIGPRDGPIMRVVTEGR